MASTSRRILFICHTKAPFDGASSHRGALGGVETTVIELAEHLAAMGHPVSVCTSSAEHVRHNQVDWQPMDALPNMTADIVISCNHAHFFRQLHADTKRNARKIIWLHNPLRLEKAIRKKQYIPLLTNRPDLVCVGSYLLNRTSALLPFKQRHVIGHGVPDICRTLPLKPLAERKPRAIWLSQPHRGLRETLTAWRVVRQAQPDAEFHAYGITPEHCHMAQNELAAQGITLHPRSDKTTIAHALAEARVMIYPGAEDETFCLAAAEAQCMGVPVVTMGIGSLAERVTHQVNGLIASDARAFASHALSMFEDDAAWTALSHGAAKQRDILSWQQIAEQWQAFLTE